MDYIRAFSWRLIVVSLASVLAIGFARQTESQAVGDSFGSKFFIFNVTLSATFLIGFFSSKLRWIQHLDTWLHEFGHATTVTMFGGVPKSIKLNQDSSGVTSFRHGKLTPFRDILISAAGPTASSFALLFGVFLVKSGSSFWLLSIVCLITFLILVSTVRTSFGWMVGILVWLSLAVTYSISKGWLVNLYYPNAMDLYFGAFLGLATGVAIRASLRRIRVHGVHGDEGKIAAHLHLPEVLVDWGLVIVNIGIAIGVFQYLDVKGSAQQVITNYPEIQAKLAELVAWFGEIPLFK